MLLLLEILQVIGLVLYYWVEGIVLFFVPKSLRSKNVNGEVVLVTGGGSGIGRLLAIRFAKVGAKLVLIDVNKEAIDSVAGELRQLGAQAYPYQCDLSNRTAVYKVAEQIKTDVGDVDILVNNAGIVTGKKMMDSPDNLIQKTMEVNTMAHFWTVKAFLPAMLAKDHGHVVTIASAAGLVGVSGLVDYSASKFGAVGLDESLRLELDASGKKGVNTTVVCPYYISTGMFEGCKTRFPLLLPILEPDYVVDTIFKAILSNQTILCLPRIIYVFIAMKNLLPAKCFLILSQFMGACNSMDDFVGRKKAN